MTRRFVEATFGFRDSGPIWNRFRRFPRLEARGCSDSAENDAGIPLVIYCKSASLHDAESAQSGASSMEFNLLIMFELPYFFHQLFSNPFYVLFLNLYCCCVSIIGFVVFYTPTVSEIATVFCE